MDDNMTEQDKVPAAGLNGDGGGMGSAESESAQALTDLEGETPLSSVLAAPADSDLQEENAVSADISSEKPVSERELDDARIAELAGGGRERARFPHGGAGRGEDRTHIRRRDAGRGAERTAARDRTYRRHVIPGIL